MDTARQTPENTNGHRVGVHWLRSLVVGLWLSVPIQFNAQHVKSCGWRDNSLPKLLDAAGAFVAAVGSKVSATPSESVEDSGEAGAVVHGRTSIIEDDWDTHIGRGMIACDGHISKRDSVSRDDGQALSKCSKPLVVVRTTRALQCQLERMTKGSLPDLRGVGVEPDPDQFNVGSRRRVGVIPKRGEMIIDVVLVEHQLALVIGNCGLKALEVIGCPLDDVGIGDRSGKNSAGSLAAITEGAESICIAGLDERLDGCDLIEVLSVEVGSHFLGCFVRASLPPTQPIYTFLVYPQEENTLFLCSSKSRSFSPTTNQLCRSRRTNHEINSHQTRIEADAAP